MKKIFVSAFLLLMCLGPMQAQDGFLGEIRMFAGNFAPRGWAFCEGQLLSINSNQALFSILGTTYGGDGRTTFALPDFRGRFPMHPGTGPGLTNHSLGQKGGTETNTLSISQMPNHSHGASGTVNPRATNGAPDETNPGGGYPATTQTNEELYAETPNTVMGESPVNVTVNTVGGGQAVNNMPPYNNVHFIICISGIFPSRN